MKKPRRRRSAKTRRRPKRGALGAKHLALTITAGFLAAAALAGCDSRSAARAPDCPPRATRPGTVGWDDPDGCWERRPDGQRYYRTTFGGYSYYHTEPPGYSKYSEASRGGWASAFRSAGGYHGAPSAAA